MDSLGVTERAMDKLLERIEGIVGSNASMEDFARFLSDDQRFDTLLEEDSRFAGILEAYRRNAQARSPITSQRCSPRDRGEEDGPGSLHMRRTSLTEMKLL